MSPAPVRSQPAFRALFLAVLLAATWIYDYVRGGGAPGSIRSAGVDLVALMLLNLILLFVFAQFSLPIKTLPKRLRLAGHLWLHAWQAHGVTMFVQNGRKVERRGEAAKSGPGLIWVDTASAVLTRTEAGPRRVLGPGIHFTDRQERVEKTFSLHAQTWSVGPGQDEPIFDRLPEDAGEEERSRHEAMQARRQTVSGLTRDGNEVVPEIAVVFKLDGQPAPTGQPGSHFGFSGEAVERAARGEGVNVDPVTTRRVQVAWNQLPGLIAVDLWREYLAKFTLDDLFTARFGPVPGVLQPEQPAHSSGLMAESLAVPRGGLTHLIRRMNDRLEDNLEARYGREDSMPAGAKSQWSSARNHSMQPGREYTALQVISHMIRARMTEAVVPVLDEGGRYGRGHIPSEEFKRLNERGLRILDVTLGGFRFAPAVEQQIVQHWKSSWLETAAAERAHVEQLEILAVEAGRQRGLLDHARALCSALRREPATSVRAALKVLLRASHGEMLMEERLHGRGAAELTAITSLIQWVDSQNDD